MRHPLMVALNVGWLWAFLPTTDTHLAVHVSGLWFEFDAEVLRQPEPWHLVAAAIGQAQVTGMVGLCFCTVSKDTQGVQSCDVYRAPKAGRI